MKKKIVWAIIAAGIAILTGTAVKSGVGVKVYADVTVQEIKDNTSLIGDVNQDSRIDSEDALTILRASVGFGKLSGIRQLLADVDSDGAITSADALDVLRYSVGIAVNSRVGEPLFTEEDKDSDDVSTDTESTEAADTDSESVTDAESKNDTSTDLSSDSDYEWAKEFENQSGFIIIPDDAIPDDFVGHIITFESNGGSHVRIELVSEDSTSYPPIDPTRYGYTFEGWFENETDSEPYVFGGKLEEDITLYARWADNDFLLTASEDLVLVPASGEGKRIKLKLMTRLEAPNGIEVKYGRKDELTNSVILLDNAQPENGDEIKGDGVYSAYVDLYDPDTYIYFVAEYGSTKSNVLSVETIGGLKEGEKRPVDIVLEDLNVISDAPGFWDMPAEDRKDALIQVINSYVEQGIIEKVFVFEDKGEILFISPSGSNGVFFYDGLLSQTSKQEDSGSGDFIESSDDFILNNDMLRGTCIMNSFPYFEDSTRLHIAAADHIIKLAEKWESDVSVIDNPTIDMYRHFNSYDSVFIMSHGVTVVLWNQGINSMIEFPCIALTSKSLESENVESIQFLVESNQIVVNKNNVLITPLFFLHNYNTYDLSNTEIYAPCCYGLGGMNGGHPENYNYYLANAFMSRSAKLFLGMHHEVFTAFSTSFINSFIVNHDSGLTYSEAFAKSIDQNGKTDYEYISHNNITGTKSIDGIAYPVLVNKAYVIAIDVSFSDDKLAVRSNNKDWIDRNLYGIVNPSFEDNVSDTNSIYGYITYGDVRSSTGMCLPIEIEGKSCVCIGTGIGSENEVNTKSKQSGLISQKVTVPKDAKWLSFRYDFISEEPMEWIGYRWGSITYNDGFVVTLNRTVPGYVTNVQVRQESMGGYTLSGVNENGGEVLLEQTIETVYNEPNWIQTYDVDFTGGDDTVFHTGWRSAVIDVSGLQGQSAYLNFIVYDCGDNEFHSAVTLDDIKFE